MKKVILLSLFITLFATLTAQTRITVYPDSLEETISGQFQPGTFYVPRTNEAQADFLENGIHQNAIRINVLEGALNNTTNLTDCLSYLDLARNTLQQLPAKTDVLMFVIGKMPPWLSSSSDSSPSATPGWAILHTRPPASYSEWQTVVSALVDRIVNTYGISDAQFEIWNEPDLGSWTGTKAEYFRLYQVTYDAVKSVDPDLRVGGPSTNYWANNIGYQPPYGYLTDSTADLSLIGELIDSTTAWNKPMDFISWHDFNVVHHPQLNAIDYIQRKYAILGLPLPELILSEWNTPSIVRETPLQKSFLLKNQLELAKTDLDHNMIAAWQDFEQTPEEFHRDYGLLTYGSIHKPAYQSLLLLNRLRGDQVNLAATAPVDAIATLSGDTLSVLLVNYVPPPLVAAINHTLFIGQSNLNQLDSAGYLDIANDELSFLTAIYQGEEIVPATDPVGQAVNSAIPVYTHFDSLQRNSRSFQLKIDGIQDVVTGSRYIIDSTTNNTQFTYAALRTQGFTQAEAINQITNNQVVESTTASLFNGELSLEIPPNAIVLYQFVLPEISGVSAPAVRSSIEVYPNPTNGVVKIVGPVNLGKLRVLDTSGKVLANSQFNTPRGTLDLSTYTPGTYFLQFLDLGQVVEVVRVN